jgi:peroxin-5
VLYFIKRDFEISVGLFDRALKLDPSNYSLWNKMGASLAHLGRPDEAIHCYHKALDIKPNYVRVWVNLGIALSFRPDAKHIWAYLQTTFMSMQRYDLIKLISQRDPSLFTEFDVMKVEDLPTP